MQHLEREAMEEEEGDCLSFLAVCGAALQVCPLETHGVLMCPLQLLMGNMSLATLLAIPSQVSTAREGSNPVISHPTSLVPPQESMATPFTYLGGILTTARRCITGKRCATGRRCTTARRWSCGNLWRTAPPEVEEWDASQEILERGSVRSLCQGLQFSTAG